MHSDLSAEIDDRAKRQVVNVGSLYHQFEGLKDKRKAKGKRYALATILIGMFLAKLCGEDKPSGIAEWVSLRGEWIASRLGLKRKNMPSHHTYRRTLAESVDVQELEALARERQHHRGEAGDRVVVAMGGKVMRGTIDLEVSDGLCLLAIFLPGEGVALAEMAIESKQNEITAAPTLLSYVDLRNKVVIADALIFAFQLLSGMHTFAEVGPPTIIWAVFMTLLLVFGRNRPAPV